MTYRVLKNGRCVRKYKDAEQAIGHVADATGKDREFIAEETRGGWPIVQDDGDQAEWRIES